MEAYDNCFFAELDEFSKLSARVIVPELLEILNPKSVVDVGCGCGSFLKEFMELGVTDVIGVDNDWVPKEKLLIPNNFRTKNLNEKVDIERKFDLALCLEVAEHLLESRAENFISELCNLSDVVVFSAAIPGQGGHMHVNEKPLPYWISLFRRNGYRAFDVLRCKIWNKVPFWYAQNMILYANESGRSKHPSLMEKENDGDVIMDFIHPELFYRYMKMSQPGIKKSIVNLYNAIIAKAGRSK
jgi:SAM-dependent methyltransferase